MCTKWKPFSYTHVFIDCFSSQKLPLFDIAMKEELPGKLLFASRPLIESIGSHSPACFFWLIPTPGSSAKLSAKVQSPKSFQENCRSTAFNAAISACSKASAWAAAFSLFHDMVPGSLRADWIREMCGLITAVLVLSALLIFFCLTWGCSSTCRLCSHRIYGGELLP